MMFCEHDFINNSSSYSYLFLLDDKQSTALNWKKCNGRSNGEHNAVKNSDDGI